MTEEIILYNDFNHMLHNMKYFLMQNSLWLNINLASTSTTCHFENIIKFLYKCHACNYIVELGNNIS